MEMTPAFDLPTGQVCAGRLTALSHVPSSAESPAGFGERFVYAKTTWVFFGGMGEAAVFNTNQIQQSLFSLALLVETVLTVSSAYVNSFSFAG